MGFYIGTAKASRPREGFIPNPKLKLLEQVGEVMGFKHYSIQTETTYRERNKRFIPFHGKRHPRDMGAAGHGRVYLPYATSQKCPAADREWGWQYVFPAAGCAQPVG
jgi:hypothetical protein